MNSCSIYSLTTFATLLVVYDNAGVGLFHIIGRWVVTYTNGGSDGKFVKVTYDFIPQIVFSGI